MLNSRRYSRQADKLMGFTSHLPVRSSVLLTTGQNFLQVQVQQGKQKRTHRGGTCLQECLGVAMSLVGPAHRNTPVFQVLPE